MPVEQLRKRFAEDLTLYPNLAREGIRDNKKDRSSSVSSSGSVAPARAGPRSRIDQDLSSVASTISSSSERTSAVSSNASYAVSPAKSKARPIVISSDEESGGSDAEVEHQLIRNNPVDPQSRPRIQFPEPDIHPEPDYARHQVAVDEPTYKAQPTATLKFNKHPPPPNRPPMQAYNGSRQSHEDTNNYISLPTAVHVPSNKDLPPVIRSAVPSYDGVNEPVINMAAGDADKAVKDLITGSIVDIEAEINPDDMIVPSFAEDIKLLPHQALGRIWMRDRETGKKTGGILADDMGLGKTIQTLTRIVEGRARKSDAAEGWSASTLVVCPLALITQWADEIQRMAPGFTVLKHHGNNRAANPADFKYHVVVTTYDIVKSEYEAYKNIAKNESQVTFDSEDESGDGHASKSKGKAKPAGKGKKKKAALFATKWWRVVLDEAHNIKNVKTKGAIACCELQAKFRWCLTGTPLQNNVQELYSLFKFLRIKPLNDAQSFEVQIGKPLSTGRNAGQALKKLRAVLTQVMLRRTKDQTLNGEKLIELPARNVNIVSCSFSPTEQEFYNALETKMETVLEKLMTTSAGKAGGAYISVLLLLLRLRQACNHPVLVTKDFKGDSEAIEPKSVKKGTNDRDGDGDDLVAAFDQLGVTRKCHLCTQELTPSNTGEGEWSDHCLDCVPLARGANEGLPSSAKLRKMLEILSDINERSEGKEKTIIFSQFTSMLDLIEPFLRGECIRYVRYDGSMKPAEREASLKKIKEDPKTRVILISFKAGSTGLNLTACNNVILIDLWWNPALEDQAFDRAHRFGQKRDVNIFKLKTDNTIEDRILQLQEKKRALAQAALAGTKLKDMRLGFDELLALLKWDKDGDGDGDEDD